jgi:hypothetical protein
MVVSGGVLTHTHRKANVTETTTPFQSRSHLEYTEDWSGARNLGKDVRKGTPNSGRKQVIALAILGSVNEILSGINKLQCCTQNL